MSTLFNTEQVFRFTVYGHPQPQGSSRAFTPKGWSRPIITSANTKLKPWRQQITDTAIALGGRKIENAPVSVTLDFFFARPKSAKNRKGMIVKPDIDKLVRGVFDALTGVCFHDDSQVVHLSTHKQYDDIERVEIQVAEACT